MRWLGSGWAMLAACFAITPARADCSLNKIGELPVTMYGMAPQLLARINGREVRFTVDSGAFYSVISPGTATENKLPQHAAPPGFRMTGIGGTVDVDIATVKTLTLAGTDLHGIEFIVGGSETGGAGVLGQNLLHIADVEYDLPHGRIALFQPKACFGKILAYWIGTQPYSELKLEEADQRLAHTIAKIRINGQSVNAVFDTGAAGTVLSLAAARRLGISIDGPGVIRAGFSRGFGSHAVPSWIVPVATIEIGGETLHSSHLHVSELGPDTDMLIGADFFLAHRVYVANSQRKLWFTYTGGTFFDATRQKTRIVDAEGKAVDVQDSAVPTDAAGLSRHGMALLAKGDAAGALADLDKAVALAPDAPQYLVDRATVQMRSHHPALAEADLGKALAIKPDDPEALVQRASLRLAMREPLRAIDDLDHVSTLLDKAADARFALGEMYLTLEQPAKALPEFDRWIEAHPVDSRRPGALIGRCWANALLGQDLSAALGSCNAALRLSPHAQQALTGRGLIELRQGHPDAAMKDLDMAVPLNPKIVWPLYGRGLAEEKLGQKDAGDRDIAAAKVIAPKIDERAAKWGIAP